MIKNGNSEAASLISGKPAPVNGSKDTPARLQTESLSLEVTTQCNSSCRHCFARAGRNTRHSMNADTAEEIIREGFEAGYRSLHITGGEPLLWKPLTRLMDAAFNTGYSSIFCNTNGMLFSDKSCSEFAGYGKKVKFSTSVQGSRIIHDDIRGKGSHARVINGIRHALDNGLSVNIFTSVGKSLIDELVDFIHWMYKNYETIDGITLIQLIRVHNDAFDLKKELLDPDDFIQMVKTAALLSLSGLNVEILENPLAGAAADILGMRFFPMPKPLIRPGRIVIMADKTITLSHSIRSSLGKYSPGIIRSILDSEKYNKEFREEETSLCGGCCHLSLCRKNGLMRPSEQFRDMTAEIPFCRRTLDKLTNPL